MTIFAASKKTKPKTKPEKKPKKEKSRGLKTNDKLLTSTMFKVIAIHQNRSRKLIIKMMSHTLLITMATKSTS